MQVRLEGWDFLFHNYIGACFFFQKKNKVFASLASLPTHWVIAVENLPAAKESKRKWACDVPYQQNLDTSNKHRPSTGNLKCTLVSFEMDKRVDTTSKISAKKESHLVFYYIIREGLYTTPGH